MTPYAWYLLFGRSGPRTPAERRKLYRRNWMRQQHAIQRRNRVTAPVTASDTLKPIAYEPLPENVTLVTVSPGIEYMR